MASRFPPQKYPDLHQQMAIMAICHPQFKGHRHGDSVDWIGTLQPTALSSVYTVKVTYRLRYAPVVCVLAPELKPREACGRIPHTYEKNRPCLYLPSSREWSVEKHIAHTIVPWLSLWLFFYELWHATGEWLGGGVHPDVVERATNSSDDVAAQSRIRRIHEAAPLY